MPQGFSKRFESEDALVEKILKRGLSVSSEDELRRIIRITGYYRFTGYLYPFRKQGSDDYEKGTTLESIWRLYSFDRRLRLIAMDALARIEVAIRAKIMEAHSLFFQRVGLKRYSRERYRYAKHKLGRTNSGRSYIVKKSTYD